MNTIKKLEKELETVLPYIKSFKTDKELNFETSDTERVKIVLKNGYALSLILNKDEIGKDNFEVCVIDKEGLIDYKVMNGDILYNQSMEEILELITKLYFSKKNEKRD